MGGPRRSARQLVGPLVPLRQKQGVREELDAPVRERPREVLAPERIAAGQSAVRLRATGHPHLATPGVGQAAPCRLREILTAAPPVHAEPDPRDLTESRQATARARGRAT